MITYGAIQGAPVLFGKKPYRKPICLTDPAETEGACTRVQSPRQKSGLFRSLALITVIWSALAGTTAFANSDTRNDIRGFVCNMDDEIPFLQHLGFLRAKPNNPTLPPEGITQLRAKYPRDLTIETLNMTMQIQQSKPFHGVNSHELFQEYKDGGYTGLDFDVYATEDSPKITVSHDPDPNHEHPEFSEWLDKIENELILKGNAPIYIKIDPKGYAMRGVVKELASRINEKPEIWGKQFIVLNLGIPLKGIPRPTFFQPEQDYQDHSDLDDLLSFKSQLGPNVAISIGIPPQLPKVTEEQMVDLRNAFSRLGGINALALPIGTEMRSEDLRDLIERGAVIFVWHNRCDSIRDVGIAASDRLGTFFESTEPGPTVDDNQFKSYTAGFALATN